MATNLAINEQLLNQALLIGGLKTKKDTVNSALLEFINRRKQMGVIKLLGTVDYDLDYDYKAARSRNKA